MEYSDSTFSEMRVPESKTAAAAPFPKNQDHVTTIRFRLFACHSGEDQCRQKGLVLCSDFL
ncbi:MAG: hypothetical protein H6618_00760 [Deltaproteobacteria bacterium]|nr:hypothetical protein [Deltaproteobacteria bacterium]